MADEAADPPSVTTRLDQVLADYLLAAEAGRAPAPAALLAAHPDLAAELAAYFADRDRVDRLVGPFTLAPPDTVVATPPAPAAGTFGDFELLEELGRGGMATVYRARQRSLGRLVALKVLAQTGPGDVARFQVEAHIAASLDHPHIVPVYEVGSAGGRAFFSMKLLEGGNLNDHLARFGADPRAAAGLVATAARAVHHAHQRGVLHRDLKPSNILLDAAGRPHLADFGLAKCLVLDSGLTQTGMLVGTPAYMAPEQAEGGAARVTVATDVYGLGAVLYALLTGRPPFRGATALETLALVREGELERPGALNPHTPRDLERICLKCHDKRPAGRYASAAALADDLEAWLAGEPIRARPSTAWERLRKWVRRRPAAAALWGAGAAALAAGVVGVGLFNYHLGQALEATEGLRVDGLRREAALRQLLYVADLREAKRAWDNGNVARARELLERYRPASGEPDLRGWEWHYLWGVTAGPVLTLPGREPLAALDVSPDGRLAATGGHEGTLRLWDLATGRLLREATWGPLKITRVTFAPDGATLAVAGLRGRLCLWDVARWAEQRALLGHDTAIKGLAFSPDGTTLAAAGGDLGMVILWDPAAGRPRRFLPTKGEAITVAWSRDGRWLASGGSDGNVRLWDPATGQPLGVMGVNATKLRTVVFGPQGTWLASGGYSNTLATWDPANRTGLDRIEVNQGSLTDLAAAASGRLLAGSTTLGTICLWDTAGRPGELRLLRHLQAHDGDAFAPCFAHQDRHLVTAATDGTVKVWDVATITGRRAVVVGDFPRALTPDQRATVLADAGGRVVLWNLEAGNALRTLPGPGPGGWAAAIAAQGDRVAIVGAAGELVVADTRTGALVTRFQGHGACDLPLAFAPDGSRLALANLDGTIHLWAPDGGPPHTTLSGHGQECCCLQFAPGGRTLASGDVRSEVCLWDPATGARRAAFRHGTRGITGLAFSPDGALLATATKDPAIKLWDVATARELATLSGQLGEAGDLAFAPDGRTLFTTANRRTVHLWNVPTRQELFTLTSLSMPLTRLGVSPEGTLHLTTESDAQGGHTLLFFSAGPDRP